MKRSIAEDLRERRPEAIDRLLAEHGREIQTVAQVILHDRDEAADILAETVIAAWEKGSSLRDPDALRPWLLRVATNRALSRRRKSTRLVALDSILDWESADLRGPAETHVAVLEGLALLAPRERAAIALRYLADLTIEEVARAMGTRPNTVKTQLREALGKLRRGMLDDVDERDTAPEVRHA